MSSWARAASLQHGRLQPLFYKAARIFRRNLLSISVSCNKLECWKRTEDIMPHTEYYDKTVKICLQVFL